MPFASAYGSDDVEIWKSLANTLTNLSSISCISGIYDIATINGVQDFVIEHNPGAGEKVLQMLHGTDPTLTPAFSATRDVVKRCAPSFAKT
jgi:hypothetical protein